MREMNICVKSREEPFADFKSHHYFLRAENNKKYGKKSHVRDFILLLFDPNSKIMELSTR